jgi:ribulose-phosphate 3-epimerase
VILLNKEGEMIKIAPSILSADFMKLGEEVMAAETAGCDMIHLDVMDGHFVPNITIGPGIVKAVRRVTRLPLDVHLMIAEPDKYLEEFIAAGADYVTVHAEACVHLHRTVHAIKEQSVKAGVSLNPATQLSFLDHVLSDIDMVLLMSVNPGFGGQDFIPDVLDKIRSVRDIIYERKLNVLIEVDGGIKLTNALEVAEAGADILVMGSAFFQSGDYGVFMGKLRGTLKGI